MQKDRIVKGNRESRWNQKYMKIIEGPVKQIEQSTELKPMQLKVGVLLKSLKQIYENSKFYKEARIVSFIDRLLQTITAKIANKVSLQKCIQKGKENVDEVQTELESARQTILKFQDNLFIAQMEESHDLSNNPNKKVEMALGITSEESKSGESD